MTLIISQASEGFGLQVSDRLVNRGGVPIDQIANKSILYVARDGIVAFSYTGIAFIEQTLTDQWLAAKLTRYPYVRVRRPPMLRMGNLLTGSMSDRRCVCSHRSLVLHSKTLG